MQRVQSFEEEGRWVENMREGANCANRRKVSLSLQFSSQETKFCRPVGTSFMRGNFSPPRKTLTVSRGTLTNARLNLAQNGFLHIFQNIPQKCKAEVQVLLQIGKYLRGVVSVE